MEKEKFDSDFPQEEEQNLNQRQQKQNEIKVENEIGAPPIVVVVQGGRNVNLYLIVIYLGW